MPTKSFGRGQHVTVTTIKASGIVSAVRHGAHYTSLNSNNGPVYTIRMDDEANGKGGYYYAIENELTD